MPTRTLLIMTAAALPPVLAAPALGQPQHPAMLAGHAVLPAQSVVGAFADAPADLKLEVGDRSKAH